MTFDREVALRMAQEWRAGDEDSLLVLRDYMAENDAKAFFDEVEFVTHCDYFGYPNSDECLQVPGRTEIRVRGVDLDPGHNPVPVSKHFLGYPLAEAWSPQEWRWVRLKDVVVTEVDLASGAVSGVSARVPANVSLPLREMVRGRRPTVIC